MYNATYVVTDTLEVSVLHIGVKVNLDDTIGDGLPEVLNAGTGTAVEDEEDRLVLLSAGLLLDVLLVLLEQAGLELDVTRLVDTVDVTETSGN